MMELWRSGSDTGDSFVRWVGQSSQRALLVRDALRAVDIAFESAEVLDWVTGRDALLFLQQEALLGGCWEEAAFFYQVYELFCRTIAARAL